MVIVSSRVCSSEQNIISLPFSLSIFNTSLSSAPSNSSSSKQHSCGGLGPTIFKCSTSRPFLNCVLRMCAGSSWKSASSNYWLFLDLANALNSLMYLSDQSLLKLLTRGSVAKASVAPFSFFISHSISNIIAFFCSLKLLYLVFSFLVKFFFSLDFGSWTSSLISSGDCCGDSSEEL